MPVSRPSVLLPNVPAPEKWAVIACDQFTGQPEYWAELSAEIGDAPSALDLILPEAFLDEQTAAGRLDLTSAEIASAMHEHLASGVFDEVDGYILVERTIPSGDIRLGLMASIDLSAYEYTDQSSAQIRASEKTVAERLPVRVLIRKDAPLESPHVMLLLDDPGMAVIEQHWANRADYQKLYDFELNMGGGHLRGWLVPDDISADLRALERDGLLFVVGDGNHSLAAAKLAGDAKALVELVNLHSAAIKFEPVHRVVIGAGQDLVVYLADRLSRLDSALPVGPQNDGFRCGADGCFCHAADSVGVAQHPQSSINVYFDGKTTSIPVNPNPADAIADIQNVLDDYLAQHPDAIIDYIHGDDHVITVADRNNAVAIFMPTIAKAGLFDYTARRGVLPRKSFSIGLPQDKRYYFELARRD